MRLHQRLIATALILVATALSVVRPARAQADEPAPPSSADAAEAKPDEESKKDASRRFRRGVELFQEGAYRAALVEFGKAYAIAPDYRLLYNIGQTKLQLQDYLGATQSYERYLSEGGDEIPAARRRDVENQLESLRERVGRLEISVNRHGVTILIDDVPVGVAPLSTAVAVNVGEHRVSAKARDGSTDTKVMEVAGGETKQVSLELATPQAGGLFAQKSKPLTSMQKGAIGAWAGAGALGVGAVVLGVLAKGKADDLEKANGSVPADKNKVEDLSNSASSYALFSDVLTGVAIAGAAAGAVLWFMSGREKRTNNDADQAGAQARIQWGVGLGAVSARGHF